MGIEDDINNIGSDVGQLKNQLSNLWSMISEILLILQKQNQPKDRQDKEKAIKETLTPTNMGLLMSKDDSL